MKLKLKCVFEKLRRQVVHALLTQLYPIWQTASFQSLQINDDS